MTLSDEYKRQFEWRSWSTVMALLPPLTGTTVLDLGCAVGDQAAQLVERGARVIGIDGNEELLAAARARSIPNAEFLRGNLRALEQVGSVDGIWCSFAAAYIPNLSTTLAAWKRHLNPGGWIALIEVDNLFRHEPLEAATRSLLDAFERDALKADGYDFHMGSKLRSHLERASFKVTDSRILADRELCFDGPAEAEVLEAWKARLERMNGLKRFCGTMFERVRADFLTALSREDHRSLAKVYACIATP